MMCSLKYGIDRVMDILRQDAHPLHGNVLLGDLFLGRHIHLCLLMISLFSLAGAPSLALLFSALCLPSVSLHLLLASKHALC